MSQETEERTGTYLGTKNEARMSQEAEERAETHHENNYRARTQPKTIKRAGAYLGIKERDEGHLKIENRAESYLETMENDETILETEEKAKRCIEPIKRPGTSMKNEKMKGKPLEAMENTGQSLDIEMLGCKDDPLDVIECENLEEPFTEKEVLNPSNDLLNNGQDILGREEFIESEIEENIIFTETMPHKGQPSLTKKASIWSHVYKLEGKTHCKYCEKLFKGKQARPFHLKTHVLDQHGERSEVQILKTQIQVLTDMIEIVDGTFICKVCDFISDSKAKIHKHVNRHLEFYDKKMTKISKVWNFAQKCDGFAKCNSCLKPISTMGGTTTGIMNHVKRCHPEEIDKHNKTIKNTSDSGSQITLKPDNRNKLSSPVWNFAERYDGFAKCKFCHKSVSIPSGSTTGIWSHVKSNHLEEIVKFNKTIENTSKNLDQERTH